MSNELDNKRIKRLKVLDEALSSGNEGLTINQLIQKVLDAGVEADRYAIKRDFKVLEDLGCDIHDAESVIKDPQNHQSRKVMLYRYTNPGNSLFKINMTQEERDFLSEAFAMLGLKGIEGMRFFRSLELKKTSKRKQIISFTKNPTENEANKWFQNIYDSIKDRKVIRIGVHDRLQPSILKHHTVHPWYLREYNRRWYLFGYDEETATVMRYTLDRIDTFKTVDKPDYRPANIKMDDILKDVVGVSVDDGEVMEILFWVSDVSADYVDRKPIHQTQKKVSKKKAEKIVGHCLDYKGGMYFTINCKENYELRREMLSFNTALVVLTPPDLRDKLKNQLLEMVRMYD